MSLFWRIFLLNAALLIAATVLLMLGPVTVSTPVLATEALILAAGVAAMLLANAVLLRIGLAPLADSPARCPPLTYYARATGWP